LAKQTVFPELIENGYTPETLYQQLIKLNSDGEDRENCISACLQMKTILENKCASKEASEAIEKILC